MRPEDIQEQQYVIPYHYLPYQGIDGEWHIARTLGWGYEYLAILETVKQIVQRYQIRRLLDFGCGDGRLIWELAREHIDIDVLIGVDISDRALSFAKAMLYGNTKCHLFTSLEDINPSLLPVEAITAVEVLEHIPPELLMDTIRKLRSFLCHGGIFIISVPTTNVRINPKHYQHFNVESLLRYMDKDFVLKEQQYIHHVGIVWEFIRRMVINRYFIANNRLWLKLMTSLYKRFVLQADPTNGAHMIVVMSKK
jgi:2-polyprenyl-3-methyl-5-hydroxy-6-metoxy-1,4-benzoquinol methylase